MVQGTLQRQPEESSPSPELRHQVMGKWSKAVALPWLPQAAEHRWRAMVLVHHETSFKNPLLQLCRAVGNLLILPMIPHPLALLFFVLHSSSIPQRRWTTAVCNAALLPEL
jgi:hypothetical protein